MCWNIAKNNWIFYYSERTQLLDGSEYIQEIIKFYYFGNSLLSVHPNTIYTWTVNTTGGTPEKKASRHATLVGTTILFLLCTYKQTSELRNYSYEYLKLTLTFLKIHFCKHLFIRPCAKICVEILQMSHNRLPDMYGLR
jgi:hypothetical protein